MMHLKDDAQTDLSRPKSRHWDEEPQFFQIRRILFENSLGEALAVAYFDFIVGLVGTIVVITQMLKASFYPFNVPDNMVEDDEAATMPRRLLYTSLTFTFPGLLICSICLFLGIQMRRCCLINFWYCPNALGIFVHALVVITGAFANSFDLHPILASLIAVRIFSVLRIYRFQKVLKMHQKENERIDTRLRSYVQMDSRELYLNNEKPDGTQEPKTVTGTVFVQIDDTCQSPPGTVSTDIPENIYDSTVYSNSKLRQGATGGQ